MSARKEAIQQTRKELKLGWCNALHGNHDEHQCHLKPGHKDERVMGVNVHECYCGMWW